MNNGLHTDKNELKTQYQSSSVKAPFIQEINNPRSSLEVVTQNQNKQNCSPVVKKSLLQRFYDLSISRKQLIALIVSEAITILGISIVSRFLLTSNVQILLLEESKSELAIADRNYQEQFNQIGFSFRSQADNSAIIRAAKLHKSGQRLSAQLQAEITQILQNRIKSAKIEYATLVGKDFKIITDTTASREGKIFNPDNLVSEVFKNPQQIQASRIISFSELQQEASLLTNSINSQEILIRYTVTPVKDPNTQVVVGALVSGDIANGKNSIFSEILKDTLGDYSAIYLRQKTGDFALVTALKQEKYQDINQAPANVELPQEGKDLLAAAATAKGKAVTAIMKLGNQTYAMAAKALPNKIVAADEQSISIFDEQSVAILVRGTPETIVNQLLANNFWLELAAIILALMLILFWAFIFQRVIIKPIQELEQTTKKFATGDRTAQIKVFATDEVGELANTFNQIVDEISKQTLRQENEAKLSQIINQITAQFRGSLNTREILNLAVTSIREAIKADRVIVYRFDENWQGAIIAESVGTDWPRTLGQEIADPCFANHYVDKYQKGRVQALNDIYAAGLTECHLAQLEKFAVKANLVAPILLNNKLYGLLIAHQCSGSRNWQELEIELLKQVAIPVGYALEQSSLLEQVDTARSRAEAAAIKQSQHNEALQQQILTLLRDIEGASQGDLTVRSEVTSGELGTVADFFNSIVESLRVIVAKVKASAIEVNTAIGKNESAIRQLSQKALKQADDISLSLVSIDQMKLSIVSVAENARQAALIAHKAAGTAQENRQAMDLVVQNILNLRSTIGDTAKKVKRLGESSQQISYVVGLINQIAMQTNFLAINAGLEATRSGVEGGGFTILVEEVASLATRCSDATQEIEQIVEKIQRETNEVVTAMELGTNQVVEGTSIVENAKNSLSQILNVSQQIDDLVQSIFLATESQVATSQAVSKLMQEISQVSELTSNYSLLASQSLQQTVEISQELQATVETFKIN